MIMVVHFPLEASSLLSRCIGNFTLSFKVILL